MNQPPKTLPGRIWRAVNYRAGRARWRFARGIRTVLHRGRPRVLANSFQKSGTYLLRGLAAGTPGFAAYGRQVTWHHLNRALAADSPAAWDRCPTIDTLVADLSDCLPGEVYHGHLAAHPRLRATLREKGFCHLFIYRDLRDVVVSLLHWWQRHEEIDAWPFRYFKSLDSDEARLTFLIEGWPADLFAGEFPRDVDYPDIGRRFAEFRSWIDDSECLAVRFEDLVDPERREEVHRRIAARLLENAPAKTIASAAAAMAKGAAPGRSRTFRKGVAGAWREHFTDAHKASMKRSAGDLLVELGYEDSLDW